MLVGEKEHSLELGKRVLLGVLWVAQCHCFRLCLDKIIKQSLLLFHAIMVASDCVRPAELHDPAASVRLVCNHTKAYLSVQSGFMYQHCFFLLNENYKIAGHYFKSARTEKLRRSIPNSVKISLKIETNQKFQKHNNLEELSPVDLN